MNACVHVAVFVLYPSIMIRLRRAPQKLFCETLNGRLPLEHISDSRQTLAKRVTDDLQPFHFSVPKKKMGKQF